MYTSAIVEYKTKCTMYNIIYSCHMNISIIIIYLILTIHCISVDEKKQKKSMNLYNTSILRYICMWNENNGNLLQLKLDCKMFNQFKLDATFFWS